LEEAKKGAQIHLRAEGDLDQALNTKASLRLEHHRLKRVLAQIRTSWMAAEVTVSRRYAQSTITAAKANANEKSATTASL